MDRRAFIGSLAGGLLAAPLAAEGQPAGKVYRIGVVVGGVDYTDNLRQGLREQGWVEGQNVVVLKRVWEGRTEQFPKIIADLIQLKVDIIVSSSTPAVRAAKESTRTIPIVMAGLTDPVGAGLISSLARPGGNITGLTNIFTELSAKRLELLKEVAPRVSRVAILWNPTHPGQAIAWQQTQQAAQTLGLVLFSAEVRRPEDFSPAFTAILVERAEALLVLPDPLTSFHRHQTADFAVKQRLPSVYAASYWVQAGGLLSYGPSFPEIWRRAGVYVDKILKGARPADLPIEQPTKYELVINLKTAKAPRPDDPAVAPTPGGSGDRIGRAHERQRPEVSELCERRRGHPGKLERGIWALSTPDVGMQGLSLHLRLSTKEAPTVTTRPEGVSRVIE